MAKMGINIFENSGKRGYTSFLLNQYKILFHQYFGICMVCEIDGLIIEANDFFYKWIKYSKEDMLNKSIFDYIELKQSDTQQDYLVALKSGEIIKYKSIIHTKTKEIKVVEITILPVMKNQTLIGMNLFILDGTENSQLEKKFHQVLENATYAQQIANIGSWTLDIQSNKVFLSSGIFQILGCTPKEFDGKPEDFYHYIYADDLQVVKSATQGALSGIEYDIEYRIVTPQRELKHVKEVTKVLLDKNKNPIKMFGIIQDITKQKVIENDLKIFGDDLNQAQKVAGIGSWKFDAVKDKVFLSEEVYRIFGVNPIDFQSDYKSFIKLIHTEDQVSLQVASEGCMQRKPYEIELKIPQPNGSMKYVIGRGEPIFDSSQQVIGIIGTIQDVSEKKLLEEKLKKNYKSLSRAQTLAHIGSWEMDIDQGRNYMSEEALRIYGITPGQHDWTFDSLLKYVHPEDIDLIQNIYSNPPKENSFEMEFRIIRSDGTVRNVYQLMEITYGQYGKPNFIHGTIQDISEKKDLEMKLEHTEDAMNKLQKQYQFQVQDSNDIFVSVTPDGIILNISHTTENFFGYDPIKMTGKNIMDFFQKEVKFKLSKMLKMVLDIPGKSIKANIDFKSRLGKKVYYELTMTNLLFEPAIEGIGLNWIDTTSRVEAERKMHYIATHDDITKIPNRLYFNKQIKLQCDDAKGKGYRFSLIMMDIDQFKRIKDALGYDLADELIIQITQRITKFLSQDKFICRYSEDKFAIIVTGFEHIKDYDVFAKEMISLFSESFKVENYELVITISMGISIYPEDGRDMNLLKKNANIALSRSKGKGKNKYLFHIPDMDIQNFKEFELRNDLRKAIDKDQIRVYYQPLVNLQTNEIIAAEALIRWEHPTWGLVPPKEFISIAEETGYIIDLGKWILKEVCRNYKQWLAEGLPKIFVTINYSAIQFYEKNFVENIKNIIDSFGLEPDFIIIEIVESVLIDKVDQVISDIKSLRDLGLHIALDDFGTGFSSLDYLYKFHIDILKIDRSFVRNVPSDETSMIITKTIINLAHELRIKIVAEGIETWDQLIFLRNLNCFAGQGYLYSKAVPTQDFKRLLAKKKCKPIRVNDAVDTHFEERRKHFRVKFSDLLEATMIIKEINGSQAKIGSTKVVITNIGPGGLSFLSNIRFPVKREIILQFTTRLLGKEIIVFGCPVWSEEVYGSLFEFGIEFTYDESDQVILTGLLYQLQIKIKNNRGFNEGCSFVPVTPLRYFHSEEITALD